MVPNRTTHHIFKFQKVPLILQYSFPQKSSLAWLTSTHSTLQQRCFHNAAQNSYWFYKFCSDSLTILQKTLLSQLYCLSAWLTPRDTEFLQQFFLVRVFLYSVQIQENTDQKNSVFGHFSRSETRVTNDRSFPEKCYWYNSFVIAIVEIQCIPFFNLL